MTQINLCNTRVEIFDRCPYKWLICVIPIIAPLPIVLTNYRNKGGEKKGELMKLTDLMKHVRTLNLLFYKELNYKNGHLFKA